MLNRITVAITALVAATGAVANAAQAQDANPRFGVWKLRSDAAPPALNLMTYEPYGDGGMRITVESTNAAGESSTWGYVTFFDGEFRPVSGLENAETAVEIVDERTNRITNIRDGIVRQVIINVLSENGDTIHNEYRRLNDDGSEQVSHAVYERIR